MVRPGPWPTLLAIVFLLLFGGCSHIAYYSQAVGGHLALRQAARPIPEVLADPAADPGLKTKLEQARAIRDFASRELALPDNGSYRAYADLGRPFAVWNVFAAPEFSVEPEQWCMPVVGCVNYRGYYERARAESLADEMRHRGFDTYVGGVPAYSTLGVFEDPLLNTFLRFDEIEVARMIFHELAHQRVFVAGDTAFNESFATAVENEGVGRWLASRGRPEAQRAFADRQARKAQIAGLVSDYRDKLGVALAAAPTAAEKRRAKADLIAAMRRDYADLKTGWGGYSGYDTWFGEDLNNAKLASVGLYTQHVPVFEALLAAEGRDLPDFYRRVQALAALGKSARQAALEGLLADRRQASLDRPAAR